MQLDLTIDQLRHLSHEDLVRRALRLQDELQETRLKLVLTKSTLADNQAIKRKSHGLRRIMRTLRSLRQTVKRRRKHAK